MENKKGQQELMFKLSMFEQQIKQLQEQMQAVERAIVDSQSLSLGLSEIKNGKSKEVLASIGKGIFAKAKLISEDLIVDVGSNNFVKKSVAETQKMIKDQVKKLEQVKKDLEHNLKAVGKELEKTFMEAQKE